MKENKSFVLIGGSYGIGSSLSDILVRTGNKVYILSRSSPPPGPVNHIQFDVTKDTIDPGMLPQAIHGLVYLPGTIHLKPFHRFTDEELLSDLYINALLGAKVIRQLLTPLKAATRSSIVLFSTVAVQQGMPFHTSVAMAKGAIEGLTRSLAAELAPKIRVNAVAPSITDTPLAYRILTNEEKKKASGERHPLKRVGTPEDIAHAAAYLLTEASDWITGQVLHVDGGMSRLRI